VKEEMKQKIAVWGFSLAGVLEAVGGLRDIFAPGFFNVSPQIATTTDIVVKFVLAAVFLALAVFASKGGFHRRVRQK
jgi:hypothetical protein